MVPKRPPGRRAAMRQHGMSLIELMVAIGIGLVLIAFLIRSFVASSGNLAVNSLVTEYQTNGRYALETMSRELRHASLRPMVWEQSQLNVTPLAAAKDFGCGVGIATQVVDGISAANDSNPYAAGCLASGSDRSYLRGDVLTLRRLGLNAVTTYDTGAPYARTSYGSGQMFLGGEAADTLPAPTYDYRVVNDIYFINEFTTSASESPKVPALYRMTLSDGNNPVMVPQLVASNVEHLQVQFGVGDGADSVRYLNPNAMTAGQWSQVVSTRIWLLLRASTPEGGFQSGTYTLGDVTYTPADNYRRVAVSSTISLRNR